MTAGEWSVPVPETLAHIPSWLTDQLADARLLSTSLTAVMFLSTLVTACSVKDGACGYHNGSWM